MDATIRPLQRRGRAEGNQFRHTGLKSVAGEDSGGVAATFLGRGTHLCREASRAAATPESRGRAPRPKVSTLMRSSL